MRPRPHAPALLLAFTVSSVPTLITPAQAAPPDPLAWPPAAREARPWTRWWWMAGAVDRPNLTRELEELARAGFGGVEVTSIYGVRGQEARALPYLSPGWLEMLGHASAEARRLGMALDMPPGSGWRTGGPTVRPEHGAVVLRLEEKPLRGGQRWKPSGGELEAAVARSASGETVLLPLAALRSGGEWQGPEGDWTLFTAVARRSGEKVKRPGPGGEGLAVDPYSRAAVQAFLAEYEERTRTLPPDAIRAYFHDSFEYGGDWSAELMAEFRRRRGYDLGEHLPALMGRGDADVTARLKSDYRQTLSEMVREHLALPLTEWAHARGSLSRNQAHGSPGNLLDLYAAADIPETEVFGRLGNPDSNLLISKFASSAAHVEGKRLCSAETATWLGEHFTVSLEQLKQVTDQLLVSGVNHVIYHGTAYSPDDAPWPGWLFYASTQVNNRNALWRDLPALNQYITRCQSVLQSGEPDNDLLLYWPVWDNWHDPAGMRMSFPVHSPDWFNKKPVGLLARELWDGGHSFDYVSDLQLQEATAGGRQVRTRGARYRALLVPPARHIPVESLSRLLDLARGGATVLFAGGLPDDVPGYTRLAERRAELETLKRPLRWTEAASGLRRAKLGKGEVWVGPSAPELLQAAGIRAEPLAERRVQVLRRRWEGGRHYFLRHTGETTIDGWVALAAPAGAVAAMDPLTGAAGLLRSRKRGGSTEVRLQLQPGESLLLRTFDRSVRAPRWSYLHPEGEAKDLRGAWSVEFIQGGPQLPPPFSTDRLASWTQLGNQEAERFAGTARYRIRFDAPASAKEYLLDLGEVAESARVRLNGRDLGTLFARPFRLRTGPLQARDNLLEVEVTNLSANRIRDLDRRKVPWKIFHDINFVNLEYRPFDASGWPVRPSGLLGPVRITPLRGSLRSL